MSSEKAVFCCYKGDTISPRITKMVGEREEKLKSRSLFSRNIHMLNSLSNQINIKELKLFLSVVSLFVLMCILFKMFFEDSYGIIFNKLQLEL